MNHDDLIDHLHRNSTPDRRWCGNEAAAGGTHHGVIPMHQDPVIIELSWKASAESPVAYIATVCLHLDELLAEGYIRTEKPGQSVRVKFMNSRGSIVLAVDTEGPQFPIGIWRAGS